MAIMAEPVSFSSASMPNRAQCSICAVKERSDNFAAARAASAMVEVILIATEDIGLSISGKMPPEVILPTRHSELSVGKDISSVRIRPFRLRRSG